MVIGKFRVENGNISGGEWKNFGWRNLFGDKPIKKVIGNLAYRCNRPEYTPGRNIPGVKAA